MTQPGSSSTGIRLAGVSFDVRADGVTVHWILGGLPHHRNAVFTLHTVERELTTTFERETLTSMEMSGFGENAQRGSYPVDYAYTYTSDELAIHVPEAHFDLDDRVFTMALHVDGQPCGEWTGTVH